MNRYVAVLLLAALWPTFAASAPSAPLPQVIEAARAYQRGDYDKAVKLLTPLERSGDFNARGALSLMYLQGRGVPKDIHTAERFSNSAASKGVPIAQHVLGLIRSEGEPPDYKEAIKWFTLAAEHGLLESQVNLGVIYFEGRWVKQDLQLGLFWTQKAAAQGFAPAQDNMGKAYRKGLGTEVDYQKAAYWYGKAAEQGYARALNALGAMHLEGVGIAQSKVLAHAYFVIAGMRGDEKARTNQALLYPQLTAEEINKATKISSTWQPGSPLPHE